MTTGTMFLFMTILGTVMGKFEPVPLMSHFAAELPIILAPHHADLVLDEDKRHIPIATVSPEVAKQTITLVSPSKAFNLPGIGGFALAIIPDPAKRAAFERVLHGFAGFPSALIYHASLAAWRDCDDWMAQLREYLRGNRDYLESEIASISGLNDSVVSRKSPHN